MDRPNAWAVAIALGVVAGRNSEKSREHGGLAGLDKVADRASREAALALTDAVADLMLGERRSLQGEARSAALFTGRGCAGEAGEG